MPRKKRVRPPQRPPVSTKSVRIAADIPDFETQYFRWRVHQKYIDYEHREWGWNRVDIKEFFQHLLQRLHEYESMTWEELQRRNSCHPMPITEIDAKAQDRLLQICPDIDTLFQVDMNQPCRLWGFRDRQIFYLIWHDPNHTVYLTKHQRGKR